MTMHHCVADDANGHLFDAMTNNRDKEDKPYTDEDHRPVWVFIDGWNGWQANEGSVTMLKLKRNPENGHFIS